jgi:hypothetical protein
MVKQKHCVCPSGCPSGRSVLCMSLASTVRSSMSRTSAVIQAKYHLAQLIRDPTTENVLYYRRQIGRQPAGYEWGQFDEDNPLPRGYVACHAQTHHERRALNEGALVVVNDILSIPAQRRYFEKEWHWDTFKSKNGLVEEVHPGAVRTRSGISTFAPLLLAPDTCGDAPSKLAEEDETEQRLKEYWEEEDQEELTDPGVISSFMDDSDSDDDWDNPPPVTDFKRPARGEGLGLDRIGKVGAWGDDDDW